MKKENILSFIKKHFLLLSVIAAGLIFIACTIEARPIEYGKDTCGLCRMAVTDVQYGAQMVTQKGKRFFYDSAECLANHYNNEEDVRKNAAHLLVTDYTQPKKLIDAKKATYLQSRELPSPMGMYITAFESETVAKEFHVEHGGRLLNWDQMLEVCRKRERP